MRPVIAAVADRGGDTIAALLNSDVGEANNDDLRIATGCGVDLDLDFESVDSEERSRIDFGEHNRRGARVLRKVEAWSARGAMRESGAAVFERTTKKGGRKAYYLTQLTTYAER
jgi:hypothetical protein